MPPLESNARSVAFDPAFSLKKPEHVAEIQQKGPLFKAEKSVRADVLWCELG